MEIGFFIVGPVLKEIIMWNKLKSKFKPNFRVKLLWILIAGLFLLLFLPIPNYKYLPSVLTVERYKVYSPYAAQVSQVFVKSGDKVKINQKLLELDISAFDTESNIANSNVKKEQLNLHQAQVSKAKRGKLLSTEESLDKAEVAKKNISLSKQRLDIRSSKSGTVSELSVYLKKYEWIPRHAWLLDIVNKEKMHIESFARVDFIKDIYNGMLATFIPDDISLSSCYVVLQRIDSHPIDKIKYRNNRNNYFNENISLDSYLLLFGREAGGNIIMHLDDDGYWYPETRYYSVWFYFNNKKCEYSSNKIIKGIVKLKIDDRSLFRKFFDMISKTFVREGGF